MFRSLLLIQDDEKVLEESDAPDVQENDDVPVPAVDTDNDEKVLVGNDVPAVQDNDADSIPTEFEELQPRADKTKDEISNEIADYFSTISQEFDPVNLETLPTMVRAEIMNYKKDNVPHITLDIVEELLFKTRATNRGIPPIL